MDLCRADGGLIIDPAAVPVRLLAGALLWSALLWAMPASSAEAIPSQLLSFNLSGQTYEAELALNEDVSIPGGKLQELVDSANAELAIQLRDDLRFERKSLLPLARYLNYLFPELDLGAPATLLSVQLNEAQLGRLFNLYLQLLSERIANDQDRRDYLTGKGFNYAGYMATRLSAKARQTGACLSAQSDSAGKHVLVSGDPEACRGGPLGQTIWVNRILPADLEQAEEDETDRKSMARLFANPQACPRQTPQPTQEDSADTQSIEQLLEARRQQYMGEPEKGIGGFPVESLLGLVQALGDVLAASGYTGQVSAEMTQPLMAQLEIMRRAYGISFFQLESIALDLQKCVRRQDYFLASAYIPRQRFHNATGEILIAVSFGKLGDVVLLNEENLHSSEDVLLDPFQDYIGKSVNRDIYAAYFAVNDLPGIRIRSGVFEPGEKTGETRLKLDVEEERFRFSLAADNFGSEFTGEERAIAAMDWYSPLGQGDSLRLGILQSIDPTDSTYGYLDYSIPVFDIAHELAFSWDSHDYDSIDGRLGSQVLVHGEVDSVYLGYDYKWRRSKLLNMRFGLRGFQKQSDTEVQLPSGGNAQISKQKTDVSGALISTDGDMLLELFELPAQPDTNEQAVRILGVAGWQASVLYGERDNNDDSLIADDYMRFALESGLLIRLPWGPGADSSNLAARFVGAYSDDILPSFEQTPLGGPFGVRAYKSYDFTADSLAFLSLEWRVDVGQHLPDVLANQDIMLGVFAEAGYGEANGIGSAKDSWAEMSGYGLLLNYRWSDALSVESSLSFPGHDSTSSDFSGELSDDDYNFLFSVRYLF